MPLTYPHSIEAKLGFDTIRTFLIETCASAMGRRQVDKMKFSSNFQTVEELLLQTMEMKEAIEKCDNLPDVSFNELESWLPTIRVEGSYSSPENFYSLLKSLSSFEKVRAYFCKVQNKEEKSAVAFPALSRLFDPMGSYPDLVRSIEKIIDKNGMVKDSASPELADVRQRLASMHGSIARTIQRVMAKAIGAGIAEQDTTPTMRNGRMVIPIPAPNKRSLSGIVHDESASGKTVFIEPAETVELSNRIRELELEEQRIIVKILIELSTEIRPFIDDILNDNILLGHLDFINAKARFAIEIGGEMPHISRHTEIDWYGAIHPGLFLSLKKQGKHVVPLDIHLDQRKRFLLISGPNAGGKSVALKTVGIVQYMLQCGMLPTLYSNSHVGLFNKLFIDIGDEQSIENDLSTYSSHLRNMRYFLLHADKKTLILIDEIGSGTEPTIGASLAQAILSELARSRCFGIVTTHYHSLKRFAEEETVFVNGAMLYDRQKLQPTFKLSIGNAGSSFALEIATKTGLPKSVIDAAKQGVGEDYVESDRFLIEIARDRKYWQTKRQNIKEREARLEQLEEKYDRLIADINSQRKQLLKEAQNEARELLQGANKKIENTIAEIRKAEAEKEKTKQLRQELNEFRESIVTADVKAPVLKKKFKSRNNKIDRQKNEKQVNQATTENSSATSSKPLEDGSYVKMEGSSSIGRILSISGNEAEVAFGQLRTMVKLNRLQPASAPKPSSSGSYKVVNGLSSDADRQRQLEFRDEIDIRGMRADEALDRVIRFIDDAVQFNVGKVRILHGTGSGILRQLVRQQLSATPGVSSYKDEDVRMGGTGITVVDLH